VDLKSEVKMLGEELAEKEASLASTSERLTNESSLRQKLQGESKDKGIKISTLAKQVKLGEDNVDLKSEVKMLGEELAEKEASLASTSERLTNESSLRQKFEEELKQYKIEVSALTSQEREKTSSIKAFEGENEELRSEVALLKKLGEDNVDLKSDVKLLGEELAEKEASLAATSERLTNESSLRQKLQGESKEQGIKISTLAKQVKEKSSRVDVIEKENEELRSEIELFKKLGEEHVNLKSEVKMLGEELAEKEARLVEASEKVKMESSQRKKFEREAKRLQEIDERQSLALKKLGVRTGRLTVDVKRKADLEAGLVAAQKLITEKTSRVNYLEGKMDELNTKASLLQKLKKEYTPLKADVKALTTRLANTEETLKEKKKELAEESSEKQKREMEVGELRDTIDELTSAVKKLKNRFKLLQSQSDNKELQEKIKALQMELLKYKEREIESKMERLRK
jgi:chromosome segregation ATPase